MVTVKIINNMKKALKYWFTFLLLLLALSFFLNSCKAKNLQTTTIENTAKNTENTTAEKEIINQAIIDSLVMKVAQIYSNRPECDSLINFYRQELANSIATSKQSGENGYQIKYNEIKKQLEFLIKVGETKNTEKLTKTNTNTTYTLQKTVEVPVHFMHWWEKLFYRIGQVLSVIVVTYLFVKLNRKFKIM